MSDIRSYRDLQVWQRSMNLAVELYRTTEEFPQAEIYGLTNQIRRSSVSVASNIAEGHARSRGDFARFLQIALGSVAELETQLELANRLGYIVNQDYNRLSDELTVIGRQLNVLYKKIRVDG